MVGKNKGEANLGSRVFFVWGSLCTACFVYAYLLIPETKGLSLEQVDRMLEETTPRTSAAWKPHETFAAAQGLGGEKDLSGDVAPTVDAPAHTNKADEVSAV